MDIKKLYDYTTNILDFTRKDGMRYYLKLRNKITIIDGDSGTGKTLLVNEIVHLKQSNKLLTGIDVDNIVFISSSEYKYSIDILLCPLSIRS